MMTDVDAERYRKALREFRAACDQWNAAGEPQSGPIFDRMVRTRNEFELAQRVTS